MSDPIYLAYAEVEDYDGCMTHLVVKLDSNYEIFQEVIGTAKKIVKHVYQRNTKYMLVQLFAARSAQHLPTSR